MSLNYREKIESALEDISDDERDDVISDVLSVVDKIEEDVKDIIRIFENFRAFNETDDAKDMLDKLAENLY